MIKVMFFRRNPDEGSSSSVPGASRRNDNTDDIQQHHNDDGILVADRISPDLHETTNLLRRERKIDVVDSKQRPRSITSGENDKSRFLAEING